MSELQMYLLASLGALFAGAINTLAGNGSAITLTILTELLGLPPNIANGTNRVGIFTQSSVASWVFFKGGKLDIVRRRNYIVIIFFGALAGGVLALNVSNEQFRSVFRFMLVFMLVAVLVKPKRWLRNTDLDFNPPWYLYVPLLFALGFYGGFIQMGMGVFFLIIMVLVLRINILESNALKGFVIALYTILVIGLFAYKGMIDWKIGGIMAVGQTLGGWLTAKFATKVSWADKAAYYMLITVLILAIGKMWLF
jgi:uncharacterized membrane protein YfcA